jgi:hypothetical protein
VQSALEKAGVELIAENGGRPSVRLRKKYLTTAMRRIGSAPELLSIFGLKDEF